MTEASRIELETTDVTASMNIAIDNFVIRMAEKENKPKKKSFEECTIDEYFDYLESFCNFLNED